MSQDVKTLQRFFKTLGAREFLCDLTDEKLLYYIAHDKNVISIPDQPDNIYRNLLFNIYTIEEFEAKFPYRVGDKVTYDVYYSVEEPCKKVTSSIAHMSWSTSQNEVIYTMKNGTMRGMWQLSMPEPKFEPKDGDVVYFKSRFEHIAIYKEVVLGEVVVYADLMESDICVGRNRICYKKNITIIRTATKEEKQKLFDKLKEKGWEWDAEKKELVKLKWKPAIYEDYYTPSYLDFFGFEPYLYGWNGDKTDLYLYSMGWCFKTEGECQAFCNRLNDAINSVKP